MGGCAPPPQKIFTIFEIAAYSALVAGLELFFLDFNEAVLRAASTPGFMPPKIHIGQNLTNCVGVKPLGSILVKRTHDIV